MSDINIDNSDLVSEMTVVLRRGIDLIDLLESAGQKDPLVRKVFRQRREEIQSALRKLNHTEK